MPYFKKYPPLLLDENEQMVMVVSGRILPSLSDVIFILIFAPAWFFTPLLMLHYLFRPISYGITTARVLAIEPSGKVEGIELAEITRFKGSRKSLMIYGPQKKLWLSRLPDAWHFETVISNVINKGRFESKD